MLFYYIKPRGLASIDFYSYIYQTKLDLLSRIDQTFCKYTAKT